MTQYDQRKLNNGQQGSGSGLDADTTDGKESTELGSNPDGTTIVEDNNGDFSVASTVVIGDFENNLGSWNTDNGNYSATGIDGERAGLVHGNNVAYNDVESFDRLYRNFDLTDYSELRAFVTVIAKDSSNSFSVSINGNTEGKIVHEVTENKERGSTSEIVVDISGYTGNSTIEFETSFGFVDYVRLVPEKVSVDSGAGGS